MENLDRQVAWNTLLHYYPLRGLQWRLASERFRELDGYCGAFIGDDREPFWNAYERKKFLGLVSLADPDFYRAWFGYYPYQSHYAPALSLYFKYKKKLDKEDRDAKIAKLAEERKEDYRRLAEIQERGRQQIAAIKTARKLDGER
jgi:hypothetical protein